MKLSILIPTLPERHNLLTRINNILVPQVSKHPTEVEIRYHDAGRAMTTGEKRNELIRNAEGEYFSFVDDDDVVPVYYVDEMLKAIAQGPDVVTFQGYMTTNGVHRQDFTIKLGSEYVTRNNHHYRFPNHLCCFKKKLVEHIKFPHQHMQEDYTWARAIHDKKILKTEVHLPMTMYHYDFITAKPKNAKLR
jgi:glycosyltransferase involved in cell wall biosynthesis